jgi:tight adherence protein B
MKGGMGVPEYNTYIMPFKEKIYHIVKVIPIIYFISYLYYKNHVLSAILSVLAFLYPVIENKKAVKKRKDELNMQFKDMLYSLQSSLSAGKSIEMAFMAVADDLKILYPKDAHIVMEALYITKKLEMNETIEEALDDFAERSCLDDVKNFTEVFRISKRTGGNVIDAIKRTIDIINDKIEIKQDIDTMLANKKLESKILNIIPVFILALLHFTAEDYINPIYNIATGRIVMTVSAALTIISYFISKKIMNIEI